jgi:hypothetical protein
MLRPIALAFAALFVLSLALAACAAPEPAGRSATQVTAGEKAAAEPAAAQAAAGQNAAVSVVPVSALPQEVQAAPASVRAAYQFAVANPNALKNVPCYCGCGSMGHTSNLSCYVKEFNKDGTVAAYDSHALGCSLCVDISTDVMRMTKEGKSPANIRQEIVAAYSKFGPPNQ